MRFASLPLLTALASFACGGEAGKPARDPSSKAENGGLEIGPDKWGTYRSKRFSLVLKLPGGSEWRIDDRSTPDLVGIHAATGSRVVARRWTETEAQSRATCEARARAQKLLPPVAAVVVEDAGGLRPSGEDVRVWVAVEPGPTAETPIRGHAALVGAHLKKCFFVHYATEVQGAKQEPELAARLAVIREGTLERLAIDDALSADPRAVKR